MSLAKWSTRKQGSMFYLDRRAKKSQVQRRRGATVLIEIKWEGARANTVVERERKK